MSHTTVYIESLAICILFLIALYALNLRHEPPPHFGNVALIYLLTVVSAVMDIVWILIDGKPEFTWLAYLTHPAYLSIFVVISGIWFNYCAKLLPFARPKRIWVRMLVYLPLVAIVLTNFSSPFTGFTFYLDESARYCRGPLYGILPMSYVYLLAASILSIKAMRDSQLSADKMRYLSLACFGLSPITLGALSLIAPPGSIPSMQYSVLFSLLLMFVEFQGVKITSDSLTGLNNRYSLDYAINERIIRYKKNGERFFILLGDMDKFKKINDTYGHMEGDRILKVVADILDSIAKDYGTRASRMGGDEFAIVVACRRLSTASEIKERINAALKDASSREDRELAISIGIAEYDGDMTLIQFLDLADQNLYLEKNNL